MGLFDDIEEPFEYKPKGEFTLEDFNQLLADFERWDKELNQERRRFKERTKYNKEEFDRIMEDISTKPEKIQAATQIAIDGVWYPARVLLYIWERNKKQR